MIYGVRLTLWALGIGIVFVLVHAALCFTRKRPLDLPTALSLGVSSAGAVGGIKLMAVAWTDAFIRAAAASGSEWYSLSESDAVFIFFGGVALFWVSCQEIIGRMR